MSLQHPQLTLSVGIRDDARFANFYPAGNEEVIQAIQQQWTTSGDPYLFLAGVSGAGCSHLLQAACHYAEGLGHRSVYVPLSEVAEYGPSVLDGLEQLPLVVLDDLDVVAGREDWEEALFHLFNRIREYDGHLLVSARQVPRKLGVGLADLLSRLSWGVVYQIEALNNEGKAQALVLRAKHRGIRLGEDVARFMVSRGPETMQGLAGVLDKLDQLSLSAQRKLTIPFIKEELGW
jgi:DnaA family protein